jgi:colanic acid biosynthesis glycosyl transferase WcaI
MRILILGINFTPELTGIGKYTGDLAHYLTQRGHQVHVVTAPPYYPHWRVITGYRSWAYQQEVIEGAIVYRCPLWVPRHPRGFNRLVHLVSFAISSFPIMLAQSRWKPQLVLCIAPAIVSAPTAWLTARLAGCKAWLHIQDFELDAALRLDMLPGLAWASNIFQRLERTLLNSFDHLSSISIRMLAHLAGKGVPADKVSLFANWVDCEVITPTNRLNSFRSEWHFSEETVIILYSGNMGHKQGLETLIESARLLHSNPAIQFVLCGEGAARASLQQQASNLSNVHFHPLLPAGQLNQLLNTADIHALTQRRNAADLVMPSKLSGMLASGRPVIATALPGTELAAVIEQVGVLVSPENPAELVKAILLLTQHPELRQKLGQRGRSYALTYWNKLTVLNSWIQEVESLCL